MATMRNAGLSVGVRLLDFDHRELAEIIDELLQAVEQGRDRSRTLQCLRSLAEFCLTHFALEEGMMAATGYPSLPQHGKNHQGMMAQLNELVTGHEGGMALDRGSLNFLEQWHNTHLEKFDLKYGQWLNDRGLL